MIQSIRLENFQSLLRADLELGKLTVIVGASNSGKSAIIRAVRTLAHNSASASFVTYGRKTAVLQANTSRGAVLLERGPGKSEYTVAVDYGQEEKYTKCGTSAPEAASAILRLLYIDDISVNVAGQFDKPFLLDEPATKVAKVLGDLTNINVIFDAIRDANRRRLAASAELKVRRADLDRAYADLQLYADLPKKIQVISELREVHAALATEQSKIAALATAISEVAYLQAHMETLRESAVEKVEVDIASLSDEAADLRELKQAIGDIEADIVLRRTLQKERQEAEELTRDFADQYSIALREAGTCPVCGASTKAT